ncbi:damage-control phosphatase ARMT1 family protein [Methanococcus voltae]|uniref:damage-control phosphatase ARMT1 family protein n=1 Tax=Methanococcus voltae TaxID=2188 RepID=UPI001AE60A4D|nr:ARMT1-like domain-containing protein [Methanococcus voltae]MBP2172993.1 uncharacterized protein with ATP-grasp and redox domains [Methanococcus voltae]
MKIKPSCSICISRQIVDAINEITDDDEKKFELIKSTMQKITDVYGADAVPAWMGTHVHRHIKEISNSQDPYEKLKRNANIYAKQYLTKTIIDEVNEGDELKRLQNKAKLAIAGNVIDFGPYGTKDNIEHKVEQTIEGILDIDYSKELLVDLKQSDENSKTGTENKSKRKEKLKIIYICDNAGEIVFDRPLVEELMNYANVTVAVKGKPILNDATMEDAIEAGIPDITKVITSGTDVIGTRFEESSEEFRNEFKNADIVISKGMGNYESLTEYELLKNENSGSKPIYYIFKAKCEPIAEYNNVNVGANVLLKSTIFYNF